MNLRFLQEKYYKIFHSFFFMTIILSHSKQDESKTHITFASSQIRTINSIIEAKEFLDHASTNALIVFDIGETLVIQKNNLLRIIRNHRIFNTKDLHLMNITLAKFIKHDHNARNTILSNMLIHSPLYLVEPEIESIIHDLQKRQTKVIAHCSSKARSFGAIQHFREWRYSILKNLGIDLSASFPQNELYFTNLKDSEGFCPMYYNGILFGGSPKGKALLALLDELKFTPSEIICFDDCEKYIRSYAREFKRRNIDFKGFVYKAALQQTPKLNTKIVDTQVKYMKQNKYIDDLKAERIIMRGKSQKIRN